MHRLRTRKKSKADVEEDIHPVPSLSHMGKGFMKKGKSAPPPEVPQVDLEHALPSSDDFRTSLLMPNLANRFSILKQEQIAAQMASGEVSRADVDADFYNSARFRGLGDISETSSIHDAHDRLTRKSEDRRPSEDSTVMSRARGGEGNVLFGGRQKVYKIASSKTLRGASSLEDIQLGAPFGRSVSRDDLPYSPSYRKFREDDEKIDDLTEHNRNRYTSSSTNSALTATARTSTAATSINSQPGQSAFIPTSTVSLPHSPTGGCMATHKARRPLYEQALDQQLQDQQSSAIGRLERLASLRMVGTSSPPRSSSPVTGMYSVPTSPSSRHAMPGAWTRRATPEYLSSPNEEAEDLSKLPPAAFATFDFGLPPSPPPKAPGQGRFVKSSQHTPERGATPVSEKVSLDMVRDSNNTSARGAFLLSASDSERSSIDQDLVIQQIGEELDLATRDIGSSDGQNPPAAQFSSINRDSNSASDRVSSRGSPELADSRISSFGDEPARDFLDALKPHTSPQALPAFSRFTMDTHSANDGSPTIPEQQGGLSLMVRQHLRADSDASSYAGSTYTRMSRVSQYNAHDSIMKAPEGRASGSSAGNIWQYEESEAAAARERQNNHNNSEPNSPTSLYPVSTYPTSIPPMSPSRPAPPRKDPSPARFPSPRSSEDDDKRGRRRGDSRPRSSSRAGTERPGSRTGTERSLSRADEKDDDQDWEQQLAFRRQIVEQNLRNQEKIQSLHEIEVPLPEKSTKLKGKNSNGLLAKNEAAARSPVILGMGPNGGNGQKPDSRANSRHRHEEEARAGRAARPHPGMHPAQQRNLRPTLNTANSYAGRSTDPMSPPRSRGGTTSSPNVHQGQPMGWSEIPDPTDQSANQRSEMERVQSKPDSFRDDLSRAMMTGQSTILPEIHPVRSPRRRGGDETMENVRSTFEEDDRRPAKRRPRSNSTGTSSSATPRTKKDAPPLPHISTNSLGPPPSTPVPPTPSTSGTRSPLPPLTPSATKSPAAAIEQINNANSFFVPAKKRVINKLSIGEPTLLSSTSNIPTISLPTRDTTPDHSDTDTHARRKRTNTLFGRGKTAEDAVPSLPGGKKLRKSTSDGGSLGMRARIENAEKMRGEMPKLNKANHKTGISAKRGMI